MRNLHKTSKRSAPSAVHPDLIFLILLIYCLLSSGSYAVGGSNFKFRVSASICMLHAVLISGRCWVILSSLNQGYFCAVVGVIYYYYFYNYRVMALSNRI